MKCANKNPDIQFICELHVTVKLLSAAPVLSGAAQISYQIRKIGVRAFCLLSVTLHKNILVRILGYKKGKR